MKMMDHPNIIKLYESFEDIRRRAQQLLFEFSPSAKKFTKGTFTSSWSCAPVASFLIGSLSLAISRRPCWKQHCGNCVAFVNSDVLQVQAAILMQQIIRPDLSWRFQSR